MQLTIYEVDAFTDGPFSGNPAAVVPLGEFPADETLQAIAAQNNLSETAFLCGGDGQYDLRWFTPRAEVDLCGHATLASAFAVRAFLEPGLDAVRFDSRSGPLGVSADGELLELDFPSRPGVSAALPRGLEAALGTAVGEFLDGPYWTAVLASEADVRAVAPDFGALRAFDTPVMVTAPGEAVDFVSRFFAPGYGIDEDPVTGSAHCTLGPLWAERLGRSELTARQLSARGGTLRVRHAGERTRIAGRARLYLEGVIHVE